MNKKYKDGIYIGKEATNEEVIFEEFKQQPLNNLELGKIGEGKKVVIDEGYKFVTEEANEELKRLQRVTKFKLEK